MNVSTVSPDRWETNCRYPASRQAYWTLRR
jgi:hypothetical protein